MIRMYVGCLLVACSLLTVPVSASNPSSDTSELGGKLEQAKKVKAALETVKRDGAQFGVGLTKLLDMDRVTGATVKTMLGGIPWPRDVARLGRAVSAWGERPGSKQALDNLQQKVTKLAKDIAALPADQEVSKALLQSLQQQQQTASGKQDQVSGLLEPIMHR